MKHVDYNRVNAMVEKMIAEADRVTPAIVRELVSKAVRIELKRLAEAK